MNKYSHYLTKTTLSNKKIKRFLKIMELMQRGIGEEELSAQQ